MLEPQEIKDLMIANQEKYGCFKDTKKEKYEYKRIRRISKFNEKTIQVIETLQSWGLPFTLCEIITTENQKNKYVTDIFIPNANIVIRQVDSEEVVDAQKSRIYFLYTKASYYPLFIRPSETIEFILEKLNNLIIKANDEPKNGFKFAKFINHKKEKRPKRPRIKAIKIEPRNKFNKY